MRKLITIVIMLIVLMALLFVAGYRIALRATLVTVVVRNNSSYTIGSARVEHEQGTAVAGNIKQNRTVKIRFYSQGKNVYKLLVMFDNNRTIYSKERQVKPGERIEEFVTDSTIAALP